jgi:hypothetical protein
MLDARQAGGEKRFDTLADGLKLASPTGRLSKRFGVEQGSEPAREYTNRLGAFRHGLAEIFTRAGKTGLN